MVFTMLLAGGCSSSYSTMNSPFKSATLSFVSAPTVSSYKDEHLAAINKLLFDSTVENISRKGFLVLKPSCEPDGLLVVSTISSLNMPNLKKGEFAEIIVQGEFKKCGNDEVLGKFYQFEEGKDAVTQLNMIGRDIANDLFQFLDSTVK
jgi:hypothetical protein